MGLTKNLAGKVPCYKWYETPKKLKGTFRVTLSSWLADSMHYIQNTYKESKKVGKTKKPNKLEKL